jgi:hypothetical protein
MKRELCFTQTFVFASGFARDAHRCCRGIRSHETALHSRNVVRRRYVRAVRCAVSPPDGENLESDRGSDLDGELRDVLESSLREAIRKSTNEELLEADRRVFDSIVELGEGDLKMIGDAVSEELNDAGKDIAGRIDSLFDLELEKNLMQFEGKRDELMLDAIAQRNVIREEAARIDALAKSLDGAKRQSKQDTAARGKQNALFAASGLFALAALTYAWRGFVDESSAAMQSAALDAVAAGAATYFYQRGERMESADNLLTRSDGEKDRDD